MAAWGNCSQNTLWQTLRLLHGAATTRPVGLPGVSLMAMTASFKSSWTKTGVDRRSGTSLKSLNPYVKIVKLKLKTEGPKGAFQFQLVDLGWNHAATQQCMYE